MNYVRNLHSAKVNDFKKAADFKFLILIEFRNMFTNTTGYYFLNVDGVAGIKNIFIKCFQPNDLRTKFLQPVRFKVFARFQAGLLFVVWNILFRFGLDKYFYM